MTAKSRCLASKSWYVHTCIWNFVKICSRAASFTLTKHLRAQLQSIPYDELDWSTTAQVNTERTSLVCLDAFSRAIGVIFPCCELLRSVVSFPFGLLDWRLKRLMCNFGKRLLGARAVRHGKARFVARCVWVMRRVPAFEPVLGLSLAPKVPSLRSSQTKAKRRFQVSRFLPMKVYALKASKMVLSQNSQKRTRHLLALGHSNPTLTFDSTNKWNFEVWFKQ